MEERDERGWDEPFPLPPFSLIHLPSHPCAQCENLGHGTFTRIYRGIKRDSTKEGEDGGEAENHMTEVVMKVLDLSYSNWVEVS